jgi:hypothetical protein
MPNTNGDAIPLRFGRHEFKISAIGFGGHQLGDAPDQGTAVRLVRQVVDGGFSAPAMFSMRTYNRPGNRSDYD